MMADRPLRRAAAGNWHWYWSGGDCFLKAIRGIIFDLDGVLVTTDELHYRAWKRLADEEGIPFDRAVNERLRGVSRMESLEILLERSPRAYTREERLLLAGRKNTTYRE